MKIFTILILRILATLIGLALLFVATLLYEDAENKIQNKLTDLWIKIESGHEKQRVAFMQTVARLTSDALDHLLGPKLISLQSVGVSLCYSYASFLILLSYFDRRGIIERSALFDDFNVPLYLILGTLPLLNIKRRKLFLKMWFILVIGSFVLVDLFEYKLLLNATWSQTVDWFSQSRFFYLGILIGVVSDILFVALLRGLLRSGSNSTSVLELLAIVLINCVFVIVFFLGPLLYEWRFFSLDEIYANDWLFTGWIAVTSNLVLALMGAMFIFIAFVMVAHRLLAEVINRFIYKLEGLGIGGRKTLLRRVGLALIVLGIGEGWLTRTAKSLL